MVCRKKTNTLGNIKMDYNHLIYLCFHFGVNNTYHNGKKRSIHDYGLKGIKWVNQII